MSKKKREYEIDFKIDAARLVEDQGYTIKEASERLGIPFANVGNFVKKVHFVT